MTKSDDAAGTVPQGMAAAPDALLLHRFRSGSEDAATQLYQRYAERLRALARVKCSPTLERCLEVDDIVQSVFRTFFRGARHGFYDVPEGEDLWKLLLVIALNKIRAKGAFHKAAKRDARLTVSADCFNPEEESRMASPDGPSHVFLQMVVQDALEQLDPRQRDMVEMRMQGYEVAEIADKTGRSKRTVERNLQEVRTKLSQLLGKDN